MIVYRYTNKVNGKVYIGITTRSLEDRHKEHLKSMGDGTYFHNALKKYGESAFDLDIIDRADTREDLCEKEKHWISVYCSFAYGDNPKGYNETLGGDGVAGSYGELNSQYGVSIKARMGDKYGEYLEKVRATRIKGENHYCHGKHPAEIFGEKAWALNIERSRARWSGGNNPQKLDPKHGKDNYNYGRTHSIEQRLAQSRNKKDKKLSEEIANDIRTMYASAKYTQQQIADKYGIGRQTVGDIINNRIYALTSIKVDYEKARIENENNRTKGRQQKAIVKLGLDGSVVERYESEKEAANKNGTTGKTISQHVLGLVKKPQYAYASQYEMHFC